ncbi:transcription initiation factor IIA large subunit [Populus alba]|uniref:Transcription initiation factor IIA large subunit-like n=1 Tax=Populus alba TaxID=43335 RepID=A0A4U5QYJ2_POPAL|nr:transcription initiation factor IIA large subunit-like isoform X1 [Populus alba]TKS16304.1 transcription initiation factor IIA large subunit-like [Populus alba]
MASSATSTVYTEVIEDVIDKVRDEFINNGGPGETVLSELQGLWVKKLMQAGVLLGPIVRSSANKQPVPGGLTPVHDLNVPYEGTEEYETPTAEMLFPPTPLQTPMQTPLPGSAQTPLPGNVQTPLPGNVQTPLPSSVDNSSMYNIPTGSSSDYPTPVSHAGGSTDGKAGRPSHFMQSPSPLMHQRPPLDVNVAYVEGRDEVDRGASHQTLTQDFFMSSGKRKRGDLAPKFNNGGFIPQQDGAVDSASEVSQVSQGNNPLGRYDTITTKNREIVAHVSRSYLKIPQVDGPIPDPYDDMLSTPNIYNYQGVANEDYNIASTPAPNDLQASTPAVVSQNDDVDDDDDEPLNEDDDDDEDLDGVEQGEELNTQHLILAQFDKVTRTKNKWKCTLKDGVMHINNRDILFNKATGEFDF